MLEVNDKVVKAFGIVEGSAHYHEVMVSSQITNWKKKKLNEKIPNNWNNKSQFTFSGWPFVNHYLYFFNFLLLL